MTGRAKAAIASGLLLVLLALGNWVAEKAWRARAQAEARQLLSSYPESALDSPADLAIQVKGRAAGKPWSVIVSSPSGAEVFSAGSSLGKTPLVPRKNLAGQQVRLTTPWRQGGGTVAENAVTEIPLRPRALVLATDALGLVGLALLLAGLRPVKAPTKDQALAPTDCNDASATFGEYRRHEQVGQGQMGKVYRATKPPDPRPYALKVILPEWSQSEDFRLRFERESQICRTLNHPGVVGMQAHGEKNGELWMAMDFVAGQELDHWLAEKPRSEGEIIDLAARLCQGLQHAHDLGIVHRDLKPANIIIVEGDRPVIADFGLARSRHYDTITKAHTTLGTPAYMAPEQGEGYPSDALADLYSLGCILYECLAGRPPFVGEAMQVLLAQLTKTPEPLSQHAKVSPEMETLVHKLLQKDKAKRYGSAEETRQALLSLK